MDFADRATADIYNGVDSKAARRAIPAVLWQKVIDKLTLLEVAVSLEQLRIPPGNRLEVLRGNRSGQHSIRINDQYRICFQWTDAGATAVEVVDYH